MVAFPDHHLVPFLHLITCTLILTSFLAVQADEQLIQSLCSKTQAATLCLSCLHNDPASKTADATQLATIYARCAQEHTFQLIVQMTDVEKGTPEGPLRAALHSCLTDELQVHDDFEGAEKSIAHRDLDITRNVLNEAKEYHSKCYQQFQGGSPAAPPKLVLPMMVVNADAEILLDMIKNI